MGTADPIDMAALRALVPHLAPDANKYSRGKLVLVGGSASYPGAACLAAAASERAGAGYTEAFVAAESLPVVRAWRPSVVARAWGDLADEAIGAGGGSHHPLAVAIGPGLTGAGAIERGLVLRVLERGAAPVLADGGALGILATAAGRAAAAQRARDGRALVVTPHAGEAARLAAGARVRAAGPCALAEGLSRAYGCVVVLKGPVTHIAAPGLPTLLMDQGTPALAKAGTGDVLAGAIGALLAQGLAPRDAAALGATLHALAGRAAAEKVGAVSVTAVDVAESLPEAIRSLC